MLHRVTPLIVKLQEFVVNEIKLSHTQHGSAMYNHNHIGSFVVTTTRLLHTAVVDYISIETCISEAAKQLSPRNDKTTSRDIIAHLQRQQR